MKTNLYLLITLLIFTASCQQSRSKNEDKNENSHIDSVKIEHQTVDTIQSIRDNYDRIQQLSDWDKIDSAEVLGESTEGGIAYFYFKNQQLEKMDIKYYGEGGYTNDYYYFKNNKVSFVLEEIYRYNAHMYSPEFDYAKTQKAEEFRFYYYDGVFVKGLPEQSDPQWKAELADRATVLIQQMEKISKMKRY